jgi:hypothetical protein
LQSKWHATDLSYDIRNTGSEKEQQALKERSAICLDIQGMNLKDG